MRKEWDRNYETTLSDTAKALVGFERIGRTILGFRIQLLKMQNGSWKQVCRWDTSHDGAHVDVYKGPDASERKTKTLDTTFDDELGYAQAMTMSQDDLRENWETYCDQFEEGEWAYG